MKFIQLLGIQLLSRAQLPSVIFACSCCPPSFSCRSCASSQHAECKYVNKHKISALEASTFAYNHVFVAQVAICEAAVWRPDYDIDSEKV